MASYYGAAANSDNDSERGKTEEGVAENNQVADVESTKEKTATTISISNNNPVDLIREPSPVHVPPDLLLPPGLMDEPSPPPPPPPLVPPTSNHSQPTLSKSVKSSASSSSSTGGRRKRVWSGANPEALARLRPVPERLSLKIFQEDGHRIIDSTFSELRTLVCL